MQEGISQGWTVSGVFCHGEAEMWGIITRSCVWVLLLQSTTMRWACSRVVLPVTFVTLILISIGGTMMRWGGRAVRQVQVVVREVLLRCRICSKRIEDEDVASIFGCILAHFGCILAHFGCI